MWVNFFQESKSHRHHVKDYQNQTKLLYACLIFLQIRKGFTYLQSGKDEWMNGKVEFYRIYNPRSCLSGQLKRLYITVPKLGITFPCNTLPESRSEGRIVSNTWWLYIPESSSVSVNIRVCIFQWVVGNRSWRLSKYHSLALPLMCACSHQLWS